MSAAEVSHGVTETRREDSASVRPAVAPALRFKGFDLSEETVVFGEVVSRRKSGARSTRELPSVEYEDVVSFEGRLCRDVKTKRDGRQGIRFSEGDVLFGKLRPYLGNWLRASFDGVAVGDWWVLEPLGLRGSYLYQLIQSNPFQLIANQSSGSKMPRSDWSVVANGQFRVVVDPKQQEALGCFLASIDSLRVTSQSALAKLQALKKSMLVNMFPQGDAKVPKIRFKGFEGEWKEIGYPDIFDHIPSKRYQIQSSEYQECGAFPVLDQGKECVCGYSDNEYRVFRGSAKPVVIFGDHTREVKFADFDFVVGADGTQLLAPKKMDSLFAYYLLSHLTIPNMGYSRHFKFVVDAVFQCPEDILEQRKIAAYFKSLDRLIAARRDEIEQLKHMKAALLNRMFV